MFPLLQRPDKSKAAKAAAREALALPEEVQEQVELRGSTALTDEELRELVPKAKGTTKTALQASAVPVATAHELKALIRAEGLPKVTHRRRRW